LQLALTKSIHFIQRNPPVICNIISGLLEDASIAIAATEPFNMVDKGSIITMAIGIVKSRRQGLLANGQSGGFWVRLSG
jgi:hypothetical protein